MTKEILEFRKQWVAALRSGEYKQAAGEWKKGDGYCCLGVANCLSGEPLLANGTIGYINACNPKFSSTYYIKATTSKTGLTDTEMQELAGRNDNGAGFHEIANYIELTYIKPFENELS